MKDRNFLTEKEVCRKYGFAVQTLRNWRYLHKQLNYYKIGRKVLYSEAEVQAFLDEHKVVVDSDMHRTS